MTINSGGTLTHTANDTADTYAVNVNVSGTVTVNSGGSINVSRKGYSVGNGPGKGQGGVGSNIGAGHGGYGNGYNGTFGGVYGSITQPFESGSGGSNSGVGGGRVKVTANTLVNNGSINAQGGGSGYTYGAGGAGGSIWIDTGTITGTGTMDVTGGNSKGAGGGRIALYYDSNTLSGAINLHSSDTSTKGGSGTLYKKLHSNLRGSLTLSGVAGNGVYGDTPLMDSVSHYESLTVNNGASLLIGATDTLTVDSVQPSASATSPGYIQLSGTLNVPNSTSLVNYYVVDNGVYSDQNPIIGSGTTYEVQRTNSTTSWNVNSLTINNGGTVTHPANTSAETYGLNIVSTNDITVNTGGSVNVQAKGFSCSNGPGAGGPAIAGYGNGGSYGGAGGRTNTTYPIVLYGSATQPTNSGSGGTCYSGTTGGGSGGGLAMLKSNSGNIVVNGTINANGGKGNAVPYGSGGSGGSIWLQANTVTGTGTLSAKGGDPYSGSGAAGGGGRIAFTYSNNLQVVSATPSKGTIAGGDTVTLSGNGFSPTTLISFGANNASVTYNSATSLTVTSPAATSNGFVDIVAKNKYFDGTVTSNGGTASNYAGLAGTIDPLDTYQTATLSSGYEYGALTPQVTTVSPNYGTPAGGNTVTITGQNFMTGASVNFGGTPASNVAFVSSTQLTATVPAHAAGLVNVTVTNTDGEAATATNAYTYSDAPTISSVSPNSGTTVGGDTVVISGAHFTAGMSVKFGTIAATNVSVVNSTTLSVTTPAGARGMTDVTVTNPLTQSATLTGGFQYLSPAPAVTSFTPTQGTMAGGTTVTFTGSGFDNTMTAYFNGVAGTRLSATSTTLRVQTPAGQLGSASVSIAGPDTQQLAVSTPFTYVPAAYSFTDFPATLHQTEPGRITIQARDTDNQPILMTQDTVLALTSTSATSQFSMSSNSGWGITSVTIPAGTDHVDFYVKDTVKGNATITATGPDNVSISSAINVISRYKFLLTGVSDPINAGTPSSVTVQTIDWQGNPLNDYTGTIHFTSSDAFAQLPGDMQFTPDMQGNHTFVNGVTLVTNGEQSVTVSDTNDPDITGTQSNITVENGYSGPASKLAVITDPQTIASNKSSGAITVQAQDTNGNPAPVPVALTVYISTTSSTGSFKLQEGDAWTAGTTYQATIPAGATAVSFYYKDTVTGSFTLSMRDQSSVTDTGLTDTEQAISVGAGNPYRLALSTQTPQLANKWNPVTITLRDDQDKQLTVGQNPPTIYLTSTGSNLLFASDAFGTGATSTFTRQLVTGSNRLVVYVRSAIAQQTQIHLSDSFPADGSSGLVDDDRAVDYVNQQATKLSLSAAASVAAGQATAVTITALNDNGDAAPVTGDTSVTLTSSGTGAYSLSSSPWSGVGSVQLPDGASSTTVYYRNQTAGTATMQANSSLGQANRSITVTPGSFTALSITGNQNVSVDTPTQYAVGLRDVFGNQTTSQTDTLAYLYTTSPSGHYGLTTSGPWTTTGVTVPTGAATQTVYYIDSALGRADTLSVSDQNPLDEPDSGFENGTLAITTVGQILDDLAFITSPQTLTAGQRSDIITVEARTSTGQPARVGADTILTLTSSSPGQPTFYADASSNVPITQITIPAGESRASFYYSDTKAGTFTLEALRSSSIRATQQVTVVADSVTNNGKLLFTTPAQTKEAGAPSDPIRIATADRFGNEAPASSDTTIALGSDCAGSYSTSPTVWNDITTITIAAGESAATVYFRSDVSCVMNITASGFTEGQQNYTIQNGPHHIVVSAPASLELNQTGSFTVSLEDIDGNVVVSTLNRTLYVSGDGLSPTYPSFVLPAGQTSQTFQARATSVGAVSLSVRDESSITAPDTGLINASAGMTVDEGAPTQLGIVSLTPSPSTDSPSRLSVRLLNASGGAVTATQDLAVSLSSSDASGAFRLTSDTSAPTVTSVILPQGSNAVDVYYSQTDAGQATLYADSTPYAPGQLDLTTASGAVVAYQLTSSNVSAEVGQTVTYTVSALDVNGNVAPMHYGDTFYIDFTGGDIVSSRYNASTHRYFVNSTTTAASFSFTAQATGTHDITVSDAYPLAQPDSGITDAAHTLTIVKGDPAKLAFTTPVRVVERGGVSDVILVQIQNAHGAATTDTSDTAVSLHSSSPAGKFSISTGGPWQDTTFTIPAGDSTLAIYYTDTSQPRGWELQATATGLAQATQAVSVVGGAPASLRFIDAPGSLVSYHDSPGFALQLLNRYGYSTNKQNNDAVSLQTDAVNGEFADSQHNWQTNVLPWSASTTASYSPTMYYRSFTTGLNMIRATLPGITPAEHSIQIVPQIMHHFVVTNVSDPIKTGVPSSIVVIAKDAAGYTVPSYDGTVTFTASDPATTVPEPYTFVPAVDRGSHTFVNGVRFISSGEKSITVTDHVLGISGTQDAITVLGTSDGGSGGTTTPTPTTSSPDPTESTPDPSGSGSETNEGSKQQPSSQPQGSSSDVDDKTGRSFDPLRTFSEPVGKVLRQLLETKNAEYTAPTVVFGVFFGYGLLFALAGYREARNAHVLAAILKREKTIANEKNEFINLLSHHLRTPITIISGMIDLISFTQKDRDVHALKSMSNRIQQDIETVIGATTDEVQPIQPPEENTPRNVYRSFQFWGPIAGAVIATIIINLIININSELKIGFSAYGYQLALAVVASVALYLVLRSHELRKHELAELRRQIRMREQLDTAKNDALKGLANTIDSDLTAFEAVLRNEAQQGLSEQGKIEAAEQQLAAISDTAKIISSISSTVVPQKHFGINAQLNAYLEQKKAMIALRIQRHINLGADIHIVMDPVLLERVLDTVLDNAQKYSAGTEPITLNATASSRNVTISVTNETTLPVPANVIDSPFTHGEASLNESVQGIGLSLYADKLILDSYGGAIDIASAEGRVTTTITLPRLTEHQKTTTV